MFTLFRRKERFSLLILGILLISAAAGLAAATAQSVQGTIDEDLAKHWRTDYDLLVRDPLAVTELEKSTESINGKFQSGTCFSLYNHRLAHPGISLYQLKQIRSIEGVEVAAPLAVVGPATFSSHISLSLPYEALEPGIYHEEISIPGNNGIEEITTTHTRNFIIEDTDSPISELKITAYKAGFSMQYDLDYETILEQSMPATPFLINVVAVDFEAEAAMHGLDEAMLEGALPPMGQSYKSDVSITLPMVLSSNCVPKGTANIKISKLIDLEPNSETMEMLANTKDNLIEQSKKQLARDTVLDLGSAELRLPPMGENVAISRYTSPEALEYTLDKGALSLIATGVGSCFGFDRGDGIQSVLGETLLGEYLALEVRGYHFILNALVFALSGLAITDTLLVNLQERQKEFGLLKAVGWRDGTISQLLIWEGMGMGLVGGIIGTGIAVGVYRYIFGFLPPYPLLLALCLVAAPTIIGGLAGLWPAVRAARISAATAIKEE